jgi:hypothetical protein
MVPNSVLLIKEPVVDRANGRGGGRHGDRGQATGRACHLPLHLGGPHRHPGIHPRAAIRRRGGEVPAQPGQHHSVARGAEPQPRAPRGGPRRLDRGLWSPGGALPPGREQRGHRPALSGRGRSPKGAAGWYWSARPRSGPRHGGGSSTAPTPPTGRTIPTSHGDVSPRSPTTGTCTSGTTSGGRPSSGCAPTPPTRCGAAPTATSGPSASWPRRESASRPSTTACAPSRTPPPPTESAPAWGRATSGICCGG